MPHIVVGLGNPGDKYTHTRHNLGFMVLDELSKRLRIKIDKDRASCLIGISQYMWEDLVLAKPQTYMNNSGKALKELVEKFGADLSEVLVICDDVELEPGRIRIRRCGGHGGHNGLRSIIQHLGTEEFPRLRIGVGRGHQGDDLVNYVLSKFTADEEKIISEAVKNASDAVECIISEDLDKAMNIFN